MKRQPAEAAAVSVVLWSRDVILLQFSWAITKIDNSHDYPQT